jgi:3',5'-nucleoside bisphosphate phosphatase
MRVASRPLLCELHAHSTWSDGVLDLAELVDVYGRAGFDVLAVTDHVLRPDHRWQTGTRRHVSRANYDSYLEQLEAEAERAAALYRLLVIPGLELTFDALDARRGAHALVLGTRRFIGLERGLDHALAEARGAGAALIGAHPYTFAASVGAARTTARSAEEPDWAAEALDRFEICNRYDFFDWVARARLPVVATGDFHRLEHLATWKTLLPSEKSEDAVIDYLRSRRPASLTLIEPARAELADAA